MKKMSLLFWGSIGLSILARLYSLFTIPAWIDETFSLLNSSYPVSQILNGVADACHPPGHYLFLKLMGLMSTNLSWIRFSSFVPFLINLFLIKKLGERIAGQKFSKYLLFLYAFSGYFVIFDWMARPYTFVVTCMLLSLLVLEKALQPEKKITLRWFAIASGVSVVGLYWDYSYLWFFLPFLVFLFLFSIYTRRRDYGIAFFSQLTALILFFLLDISIFSTYQKGISGILWMKDYLSPAFFVPYFFGTHSNWIGTGVALVVLLLGGWVYYQKPHSPIIPGVVFWAAGFSYIVTIVYSLLLSPLFHVRSLQIIPLALLLLGAYAFEFLMVRFGKLWAILFGVLIVLNFLWVLYQIPQNPGLFLIAFS